MPESQWRIATINGHSHTGYECACCHKGESRQRKVRYRARWKANNDFKLSYWRSARLTESASMRKLRGGYVLFLLREELLEFLNLLGIDMEAIVLEEIAR